MEKKIKQKKPQKFYTFVKTEHTKHAGPHMYKHTYTPCVIPRPGSC